MPVTACEFDSHPAHFVDSQSHAVLVFFSYHLE